MRVVAVVDRNLCRPAPSLNSLVWPKLNLKVVKEKFQTLTNYLQRAENTKYFGRRPATHLTVELPINCKILIMLRDKGVTKKSISHGLIMFKWHCFYSIKDFNFTEKERLSSLKIVLKHENFPICIKLFRKVHKKYRFSAKKVGYAGNYCSSESEVWMSEMWLEI